MNSLLLILGALMLWAVPAQATRLITEDFEITDSDLCTGQAKNDLIGKGWGVYVSSNQYCSAAIVSMTGHTGATTKALRFQYQGTAVNLTEDHNATLSRGFSTQSELYERYYYRTAPIPPATQSEYFYVTTKQHYFKTHNSLLAAPVTVMFWGGREFAWAQQGNQDCGFVSCNDDPNILSVPLQDNVWYCIETHVKLNTTDTKNGIAEIWVNGQLTTQYTHNYSNTALAEGLGWTEVQLFRQNANNMYRYEDDWVVATTRIGCGSTPAPTDTQAPASPIGLFIR